MDFLYRYHTKIKHSDLDMRDMLAPWCILELFQEAAYLHVNNEEAGYQEMLLKNALWVLISVRIDFFSEPDEEICVTTWQLRRGRAEFIRDYLIESNGKKVATGSSKWCLIDKDTRRILPTSLIPTDISGEYIEVNQINKINFESLEKTSELVKVEKSMIDHNFHMNNCHYARWIYNSIELNGGKIKTFEISFLNEAVLGDEIELRSERQDNYWFIEGYKNNKICFKARVEVENAL